VRAVSAARRKRDAGYQAARLQVMDRSEGICETVIAGRLVIPGCNGQTQQVHHIAGRTGPDPHHLDNLLGVCRPCHEWITEHPKAATKMGLQRPAITRDTP
jgi:hypothetical protein